MMKRHIWHALGMTILMIGTPSISNAQYDSWKTFTSTDGLVGDFVYTMLEDTQGRLWFGTNKGVSSFDGIAWTSYRVLENCVSTGAKTHKNYISSIAEDKHGVLWFGTIGEQRSDGCGVLRFDGANWTSFTAENSGLADNKVYAVLADRKGILWFATDLRLSRYNGSEWTTFDYYGITAMFEDRQGILWFGLDDGAIRYDGKEWIYYDINEYCGFPFSSTQTTAIFEDSRGAMWFGTGQGVCRNDESQWTRFGPENSDLLDSGLNAIIEDNQGALWFATDDGVCRYDGKDWKSFTPDNSGLPGKIVLSIVEDINGTLWFATKGYGVARYEPELWVTFSEDSIATYGTDYIDRIVEDNQSALWFLINELDDYYDSELIRYDRIRWQNVTSENSVFAGRSIYTFIKDNNGTLWFATDSGAVSYDGKEWRIITTSTSGLTNDTVYAIIEDSDRALWFGTQHGVSRYDGTKWTTFTTENSGLAGDVVYKILTDKQGKFWFLIDDPVLYNAVVSQYDGEKWKTTIIPSKLQGSVDNIKGILVDYRGTLWVGTSRGLGKYENDEWTILNEETHTLGDNRVTNIFEDSQGILWVTTDLGGVSRYDGREWKILTTGNSGLVCNRIYSIYEDHRGALWFGGTGFEADRGGLNRLEKEKWLAFTRQNSGLVDDDIYLIYEDSRGDLWLAAQFNVIQFKGDKRPPNTVITGGPMALVGTPTSVFTFRGGDNFSRLDDLLFSTAVIDTSREPVESDWSLWSSPTFGETRALSNGAYTFYVRTRDDFGNVDPTPAKRTFMVDITPPTVTLTSPKADGVVAGRAAIIGSAFDTSPLQDFQRYRLRYGTGINPATVADWDTVRILNVKLEEIRDDTLAIWDTDDLPNGSYVLQLSAYDKLGHESQDFVKVEVVKAAQEVNSRRGTNFFVGAEQLEIYIPPNAVSENVQINVRDHPIQDIVPPNDPQVTFTNLCFKIEITPNNPNLDKPATLTLYYPDSVLTNKNEKKLALYHSSDGKSNWQRLGGSVDVEKNKITTTFKQAGVFALYEDLSTGNKAGILNVTSQPRVFSPQGGGFNTQTAISFDLGKESNVTIKIYNAAGRLVRVLTENEPMAYGTQVEYWDGKDQSGHYCLSGLHLVTIQAEDKMVTKTVVVLNK